ncbi:hypothetical protein [Dyadobacter alkalitolerans]|uniref:hypothetical protein n=1 Tax=Dyadobacter alkalitolerans TaxID=492736 RepID=UPI00047DD595|nr:hypothetical protein [Dyadobacter alkalitolerans]
MKSAMKVGSVSESNAEGSYDASLDRLEDKDLFPAKTAIAKATLSKTSLPVRKGKLLNSSST